MSLTILIILSILPALIAAAAFFSASETALFGLSYNDRLQLRRLRPRAAAAADAMLATPRALLITVLMANMTVSTMIFVLSSVIVLEATSTAVGVGINTTCIIALILFGDLLPKMLAGSHRITFCRVLAPSLLVVFRVLSPLRRVVEFGAIAPVSRLFHPAPPPAGAAAGQAKASDHPTGRLGVDELAALVELGATQGVIDAGEQALLAHVVELGMRRVRDVMTPRVRIQWVETTAKPESVIERVKRGGHRHLPVYRGSSDSDIAGILDARPYLAAWSAGKSVQVTDFLFPASYIPEQARLDQLLSHFRTAGVEIALCVDEYGAVDGLITLSDIADRFVAEYARDPAEDRTSSGILQARRDDIEQLAPDRWRVPGRLSVHDWAELFGQQADRRVSTVAGLVMTLLGRVPRPGDRVYIGQGTGSSRVCVEVESVKGNIVDRLIVSIATDADAPSHQAGAGA